MKITDNPGVHLKVEAWVWNPCASFKPQPQMTVELLHERISLITNDY